MKKGKTTDGLMRHIRDAHNINIGGSSEKKKLIAMGYFHGYKAYRFYKDIHNPFPFNDFKQIIAINTFDEQMKTCFYPLIMKFENLMKNYLIEQTVANSKCSYEDIFAKKLINYRSFNRGTSFYKKATTKRLTLKKKLDSAVAYNYQNDNILIKHYIENNKPIPLWGIFETVSLGVIGDFAAVLNAEDRTEICKNLNIYSSADRYGTTLYQAIYAVRELRNSIAHNSVIFDCRFNINSPVSSNVKKLVSSKLRLGSNIIYFDTIFDYFALLIIILKESGTTKTELKHYFFVFNNSIKELKSHINDEVNFPRRVYRQILSSGMLTRLEALKKYISDR